jgi:hypothetical protein
MFKRTGKFLSIFLITASFLPIVDAKISLSKGNDIVLVGAGMGSRMIHYGHFETEVYLTHADLNLKIRNLCDEGNTPGFRPHPSRNQEEQYAFPGAKELIHESLQAATKPKGHFPTPDQWLSDLHAEVVLCFFGFNSSFDGPRQADRFKKELDAYIKHLKSMPFGQSAPQIALISPTAVESVPGVTDGRAQNRNLSIYTQTMREVAIENKVLFVDCFAPSRKWYEDGKRHTVDGALYNDHGYRKLAKYLAQAIFKTHKAKENLRQQINPAGDGEDPGCE